MRPSPAWPRPTLGCRIRATPRHLHWLVLSAGLAGTLAPPVAAADGDLHPGFGSPGTGVRVLAYDLGGTRSDRCGDIAGRSDGVLVVGGTSTSILGDDDWTLSWLAQNGATLSFRTLYWDLPGGSMADTLGAVAFDHAGRTLAAGLAWGTDRSELRVCRMNAGNFLNDPAWNGGSCVAFDLGANVYLGVKRIVETPDQGVLIAGTVTQPTTPTVDENWYVLKLTSSGALDSGFGFFGIRVLAWNAVNHGTDRLTDLAVDPQTGAIFVVGSIEVTDYFKFAGLLAKLTAAGNLDTSWGPFGGYVDLELRDGGFVLKSSAQALALDPAAGVIWVALQADSQSGVQLGTTGVCYEFGLSEPIEFPWVAGTSSTIARLLRLDDGRLLVAGSSSSGAVFAVSRLQPYSGTFADLDPTFGAGGTATFDANLNGWGNGQHVCGAALSVWRVVLAGDSDRGDIDQLAVCFSQTPIFAEDFEGASNARWTSSLP